MNSTDYTRWRAEIPRLTTAQRQEVALLLKQFGIGSSAPAMEEEEDWLLSSLLAELRRRGLVMKASRYQIKRLAPHWPEASTVVRETLLNGSAQPLSGAEQLALGAVAVQVYLSRLYVPLTLANCLRLILLLPPFLDAAYPDYIGNQLLHVLITQAHPVSNPDDLE